MNISYDGIGQLVVTFPAGDCVEGQVCMLDSLGRACTCAESDAFIGFVQSVDKNMASVIVEGFVKVSYTGTPPCYGSCGLLADGNGGVLCCDDVECYLVAELDTVSKTCVIKL